MKKHVQFCLSEDGKSVIACNRNFTKYAMATCGNDDKSDLFFGMRIAAMRLFTDSRKIEFAAIHPEHPINHMTELVFAFVEIPDATLYGFAYNRGADDGLGSVNNSARKLMHEGRSKTDESFVRIANDCGHIQITIWE